MSNYTRTSRAADSLRDIKITPHLLPHADGSCLIECGNTKVICTASIDENVPPFLRGKGQGWVTAEYGMLPASTASRMRREATAGAFVALQIAVNKLLSDDLISENPIREAVAAVSAGVVNGVPLLDLDYPEDSGCDSDVNIVMTASGKIIEIQGTAEGAPFSLDELGKLIALAQKGIAELTAHQQNALSS